MRSQTFLASISLAVMLGQAGTVPPAAAISHSTDSGNKQLQPVVEPELQPVPPTPKPASGSRTPGGGLGDPISVCPETSQELTAIAPADVYGRSISNTPTFWFYVPYTAADVDGKFSVVTEDEFERVYEIDFELPEQPGLVSVTLPADVTAELEELANYHWYLQLSCVAEETIKTNLTVDGWLQWLQPTPERQQMVNALSPEFWYDVLDSLAVELPTSSADAPESAEWSELLQSVDLAHLAEEPIAGPVIVTDE